MKLPFEMTEYRQRLDQVKKRMEEHGVDVLLVANPSNIYYLTGYDAYSFYVIQSLIVIKEEDQPIWVGRREDANGAKLTTWLDDNHIFFYTDDYIHSSDKHPMDYIANLLLKQKLGNRRIGVDMDNYYFTAMCYEKVKAWLPNATLKNTTTLINGVRIIKSNQELEYMKNAAAIAEHAMETGISSIQKGARESEVVADIYHAQISGTNGIGGDYPAIVPLLLSGVKTSSPHLTWGDSTFQGDELAVLELAGCYRRYHSPLARTVKLGTPSSKEQRLADAVYEGINATLASIKPGITCEEAAEAWTKTIKKHGFEKHDRLGYSVGLSYPPDWGESTASIRHQDQTVLQPNMAFHLIPGIWDDDCGVEISETFVVTEGGCKTLASYQREMVVKQNWNKHTSHG